MAQTYIYPVTAFPNNIVDLSRLNHEIRSSISIPLTESTSHEGNVNITFTQALTGTGETDLNNLVAVHSGLPFQSFKTLTTERIETFTSTASAYTIVLSLSASEVPPANYRLLWSVIYGIDSGAVNFRMRVQQNNIVTKAEHVEEVPNADPEERIPRSGFLPITIVTPGNYHWDIECGKEQGGEEAWKIFKAFLELRRLD